MNRACKYVMPNERPLRIDVYVYILCMSISYVIHLIITCCKFDTAISCINMYWVGKSMKQLVNMGHKA